MSASYQPELWKVSPESPERDIMERAASCVRRGGIIIYPTETFYGLGGDPFQGTVIQRIFSAKGRDSAKPLPLIAADMESVLRAVAHWPRTADRLSRVFWPGPVTLVVRAAREIPEAVHAFTGKVALRVSSHPVARLLASAAGGLLISTSANLSDTLPAHAVEHVSPVLFSLVDGILDAGPIAPCSGDLPSTIVDVTGEVPRLAREGCVPWKDIETCLCPSGFTSSHPDLDTHRGR